MWNHDVIHKPEVHNVSQSYQSERRTKLRPQTNCTRNSDVWQWGSVICERTDRQTDRQTCTRHNTWQLAAFPEFCVNQHTSLTYNVCDSGKLHCVTSFYTSAIYSLAFVLRKFLKIQHRLDNKCLFYADERWSDQFGLWSRLCICIWVCPRSKRKTAWTTFSSNLWESHRVTLRWEAKLGVRTPCQLRNW